MTPADKKPFLAALTACNETLAGPPLSAVAIDGWWEALKPFGAGIVLAAFSRASRECKYWPRPAHVLGFIREMREQARVELVEMCRSRPLIQRDYWQAKYRGTPEEGASAERAWAEFEEKRSRLEREVAGIPANLLPEHIT